MKGIFISYRRQDTAGYAGRLYDRLAHHFGADRVFMDVEGIEPGLDFVDAIERAVGSCEVLIVIIGPGWLATDSAGKRRLDDPKDFVRIETGAALGRHIRVVPVLVDKAVMPLAEELPADLAPLVRRQAIELSNKYWDATTGELIRTLERVLDGDKPAVVRAPGSAPSAEPEDEPLLVVKKRDIRRPWVIAGALALLAAAVGLYIAHPWDDSTVRKTDDTAAVQPPEKSPQTAEKPPAPVAEKAAPAVSEKAAPITEKAAPIAEKPATPPVEKAAEQTSEKIASATKDKTASPAAEKPAPEKATPAKATPEKAAPAKATPEKAAPAKFADKTAPAATAPTKTTAPESSQSGKQPDEKIAVATPAQPAEKPSAPVASPPPPTSPVTEAVATASALPATLPRIGDTWEYRMTSKWPTVPARTYTHRVTAVSAAQVAQTISVSPSPDGAAAQQVFTPGTRFVEWRGPGFYLLEFNPFLGAFGTLQSGAAVTNLPPMPPENPMYGNWTSRARVRGSESVTVPAGTFNALKLEIDSTRAPIESAGGQSREPIRTLLTVWYATDVKRIVRMFRVVLTPEGMHLDEDTYELVRYRVQ